MKKLFEYGSTQKIMTTEMGLHQSFSHFYCKISIKMVTITLSEQDRLLFLKVLDFFVRWNEKGEIKTQSKGKYYQAIGGMLGNMSGETVSNLLFVKKINPMTGNKEYITRLSEKAIKAFFSEREERLKRSLATGQQKDLQFHHEDFKEFKKRIDEALRLQKLKLAEEESEKSSSTKFSKESANTFIKSFQDTTWYCFSRHDRESGPPTIGRILIKFGKFNRDRGCTVTIDHYKDELGSWKGRANFDEVDKILFISAVHSDTRKGNPFKDYTHFLFKVDHSLQKVDLCLGHVCYRNKRHLNIISKAVIMAKPTEQNTSPTVGEFKFDDEDIDPSYRSFFRSRALNRMSSPHSVPVYDLESLGIWLQQFTPPVYEANDPVIGTYKVYYRIKPMQIFDPADDNYVTDVLEIKHSVNGFLEADYKHEEYDDEPPGIWKGQGHSNVSTKVLAFLLSGPIDQKSRKADDKKDKPLHLLLNIPPPDKTKIDVLTGIITGHRDKDNGTVSRLAVFIRTVNDQMIKEFNQEELNNFFYYYRDRSWVRPPISPDMRAVTSFKHLAKAIADSERRFKKTGVKE